MKKIISATLLSIVLLSCFGHVQAAGDQTTRSSGEMTQTVPLQNPLGAGVNSISELVFKVINFIAGFLLAIAAFFIIYSGFKFVAASGNPDKLQEAKDSLKNALIGTALILVASTVGVVIENLIKSLQTK